MQTAHSSKSLVGLPFGELVVVDAPPELVEPPSPLAALVVRLATVAEPAALRELDPPHPANAMAVAAAMTASPAQRRYVAVLPSAVSQRFSLPFIGALSSTVRRSGEQFYEPEGHSPVMAVT